ncbi:Tungsten-containing formate dehydrogenase beta subunit [Cycloclasticus sp. P1]|nr:Tungsten-containing formate dehydrogenase beta subunit [Cycloclasticus sp. P1]
MAFFVVSLIATSPLISSLFMPNDPSHIVRPGNKKKRKGKFTEKGRQLDANAQQAIKQLLANKPHRKDLLIEYLHLIQDTWSYISEQHLMALADILKLPQAAAYEVATFYHHFDVIKENEAAPPPITIRVCQSLSCCLAGADNLILELTKQNPENIRITSAPCMGLCNQAPAAAVGKNYLGQVTSSSLLYAAQNNQTQANVPTYQRYEQYINANGYQLLASLSKQTLSVTDAINEIEKSNLKGLGGAGFPTASKLRLVKAEPAPKYFCVNADEGEPGTFKDRHYLSTAPHQFLEGLLIAAYIIDANKIFIYLRDEYPAIHQLLHNEIQLLVNHKIIKEDYIEIRRGAGAYICGEESAMIESIEGKRGIPRQRPPYVAHHGLFGRPTLVQNVETLYWIPTILTDGGEHFAQQGKNGASGLRTFSVSGRINKPGVIVAPAGSNIRELIHLAGGMLKGHSFKAYLPGGASGGILPSSLDNIPLDFGSLTEHGCFIGSHAIIVLSDKDSIKATSQNLLAFFNDESCGQCSPCRVGCEKASSLLSEQQWNKPLLKELCTTMADASICGLGQAAPNPILSSIKYFGDEV